MKKFILLLCIICLGTPIMLVGCSRNYTIKIETIGGYGSVTTASSVSYYRENLVGKNKVKKGEYFEFSVVPRSNYQVKYISVDGKKIDFEVLDGGLVRKTLPGKIDSNHNIVVAFEAKTYHVTYKYFDGSAYQDFVVDGKPFVTDIVYDQGFDDQFLAEDFLIEKQNGLVPLEKQGKILTVTKDTTLYYSSSRQDLQELLLG